MTDHTESFRREMIESNQTYVDLAAADKRMTTAEMSAEYSVIGFAAPFVVVTRKADGVKGSLEFTHSPRFYFNFTPDEPLAEVKAFIKRNPDAFDPV